MCENKQCLLEECNIINGTCHCGCGEETHIVLQNNTKDGRIKGEYSRYVSGHQCRLSPVEYLVNEETGCWEWQRSINSQGYGNLWYNGKEEKAHRVYYMIHKGPIPDGLEIDHLCGNTSCVNPEHLEAVTKTENIRRCPATKLTWKEVNEIRFKFREKISSQKDLGKEYGISLSQICGIINNKFWIKENPSC